MNKELIKTFNLTSIFADIKSEHNWTTNEVKTVLMLFSQMNNHAIYIPDLDDDVNVKTELKDKLKEIPREYVFTKEKFAKVTGVSKANISREINKVRKGLISKVIHTPHPVDKSDDSGVSITWFSKIEYKASDSEIVIKLNDDALERLVAFVKYTRVSFKYISSIKNHNSIYIYLLVKIILDSSRKNTLKISIIELKEKLNLINKYKSLTLFKKHVLDIAMKEINDSTDISFNYSLEKVGRAYKYVIFEFNHKKKIEHDNIKQENDDENEIPVNTDYRESYEITLLGWGISDSIVIKIKNNNDVEVIKKAINITQSALTKGTVKNSPANYFFGVLEQVKKQYQATQEAKIYEKAQVKRGEDLKKRSKQFDVLKTFVLGHEQEIRQILFEASMYFPVMDHNLVKIGEYLQKQDKSIFENFKVPLLSYKDFSSNVITSVSLYEILEAVEFVQFKNIDNLEDRNLEYMNCLELSKNLGVFDADQLTELEKIISSRFSTK